MISVEKNLTTVLTLGITVLVYICSKRYIPQAIHVMGRAIIHSPSIAQHFNHYIASSFPSTSILELASLFSPSKAIQQQKRSNWRKEEKIDINSSDKMKDGKGHQYRREWSTQPSSPSPTSMVLKGINEGLED